jgi:PST family polysaccharide transporter
MKIDQVMIKWLISDEANGMYGVAVRLSEMWNFIPVAICASFFPAILNAKLKDETLYKERLQKLYDLMVSISVVVAIAMTVLSPFIVRTLFGEQYSDSADILTLYLWSGVFVFLGVANGKWIIAENLQVFRMNSLVAAGILNIILNFIFIRWFGLRGAAISTIISYAFASYFSLLLTRRTRPAFIACTRSFNPFRIIQHLLHYKPE